jgi:nitroreductase
MEYKELLQKRRSIREFEDKDVALETVEEIIQESYLAPSSGNRQEWRFVIVNNREWVKRVSDESKKNILQDIQSDPNSYMKRYQKALENENFNVFYNAPCLVLILGPRDNHTLEIDCSLIAAHFMLSAAERGLGTCWVGLGKEIRNPEILAELGIPDEVQLVAPIALGYPKEIPTAPQRKDPQILKRIV